MDDCDWMLSVEKACDWLRIEPGVTWKFFLGHSVYVEKTIQILPPITDEDLLVEDCSVGTEERDGVETVVI